MVKKEVSHFCHGKHLRTRNCCKGLAFSISFPIGAVPLVLPRGLFLFPKAAAKGSFKKSAVIKDCHQTSPKALLK